MPKVPVANGGIQTKESLTNAIQVGKLDQSIIGQEVFRANDSLNNSISKATNTYNEYAVNEMKLESERRLADTEFEARKQLNDLLTNQDKLEDGRPKGLINRELDMAPGIANEYQNGASEVINKSMSNLNDMERERFVQSIRGHSQNLFDKVVQHEADQKDKRETISFKSLQQSYVDDASLYSDDKRLIEGVGILKQKTADFYKAKGHGADSIEVFQKEAADKMINNNIMAKLETDPDGALKTLELNKENVSGEFYTKAKNIVEGKRFDNLRKDMWDQSFSRMRMSDGNVDLGKVKKTIDSNKNLTNENKTKLFDYAQARAGEDRQIRLQSEAADLDGFYNAVATGVKQKQGIDDMLRLVGKFGGDPKEKMDREEYIKKLFSTPSKSNPEIYLSTWEKVQEGSITKDDIREVWKNGAINNSDFESLSKELYSKQLTGEGNKGFQRIKLLADQEFTNDKTKKAEFLYLMKEETKNMKPEEAFVHAQDSLKKVVTEKGRFWDTKEVKWKLDLQNLDAKNSAIGMVYQDLGKDGVNAVMKTLVNKGVKQPGFADIENFAKSIGGYDRLKKGTPEHDAILGLQKLGKEVTPQTIQQYITLKKNGKI